MPSATPEAENFWQPFMGDFQGNGGPSWVHFMFKALQGLRENYRIWLFIWRKPSFYDLQSDLQLPAPVASVQFARNVPPSRRRAFTGRREG